MEDKPLVVTEEYERLGKKLSLIDVLAQSVGFMGPVFASAFVLPLMFGFGFSGRGAGTSSGLVVLLSAIGVFALAWIVSRYAKKIHAAGSLYDYVTQGLGKTIGASAGWLYYGGTIVLTTALGVLLGGYVHDNLLPAFEIGRSSRSGCGTRSSRSACSRSCTSVCRSRPGPADSPLISMAVVLIFVITVIVDLGSDNDFAKVRPDARRRVLRDPVPGCSTGSWPSWGSRPRRTWPRKPPIRSGRSHGPCSERS